MPQRRLAKPDLNPQQLQAVKAIEGPVMVIAGPGTGKTHTLISRIAYILEHTDTPAEAILALTFTEAAAREMKERLAAYIGPTAYYVTIQTFHAFCSDIIRTNPDAFPSTQSLESLSELERMTIFREIIDNGSFEAIRPHGAPYLYLASIVEAIGHLKREGVSINQFEQLVEKSLPQTKTQQRYHQRSRELTEVYRRYQQKIVAIGRYDYEDMINLTVTAFKSNPDLLLTYQQRYLYFLVDEYQDTNAAQNQLLMLLISYWQDQANIFVVGDDDQAIFRFQGASIENILEFHDEFPKSRLITLKHNYRSGQPILDCAKAVINNNKLTLVTKIPEITKSLVSKTSFPTTTIHLGRFSSGATEQFFIAKQIQELLAQGIPASEIAVIYRHHADGAALAEMLARLSIPYDIEGGENVLTNPDIQKLMLLMRAVDGVRRGQEGVDLFTLLNFPFMECDQLDTLRLMRYAADKKIGLWDALLGWHESGLPLSSPECLTRAVKLLSQLQTDDAQGPFVQFFEKVINKSGFLNWCLKSPDAVEKLNAVNSLFVEIKRLNAADHTLDLGRFLTTVELMVDQHIPINERDLDIRSNSVALLTAHRAKGREFQVVFIFRATDGKWGNNRVRELIQLPPGIITKTDLSLKEKNEDERRLFYVAMTRAKQRLYITSAQTYTTTWGQRETVESMFVFEIPPELTDKIDIAPYEGGVREILETLLTPIPDDRVSIAEADFLKRQIARLKLSPTALNTYLACPYKFKLNTLLRAPRAKSIPLSYGSAIHKALEVFFKQYKSTRQLPEPAMLKQAFVEALKQEIITTEEMNRLSVRGTKTLASYLEYYQDQVIVPLDVERFFGYGFSQTILDSVPLSGKIDKIEPMDGTNRTVRVIDYKTGQPKSRGEIEGHTSLGSGDYKRQLVFYYLLAELDKRFTATVAQAELDFVEPDRQSGKFKKEQFTITREEIGDLKRVIKKAWGDITALKFPRTREYAKYCQRCEWRLHCWPDGLPLATEQLSLLQEPN